MARSTNKISLTVKKLLAAEPLRVYQSINGKKTVYKYRRRHFKTSKCIKFLDLKNNFMQFQSENNKIYCFYI